MASPINVSVIAAREHGITPLPTKQNCKAPLVPWKEHVHRKPTAETVESLFKSNVGGVGYLLGTSSDNLMVLDIETAGKGLYDKLREDLPLALWGKLTAWEETSPGGIHLFFRLEESRVKQVIRASDRKPLIEILGQGNFVVAAPTRGVYQADNESKGTKAGESYEYKNVRGGPENLVTLSEEEAEELYRVLWSYNEAEEVEEAEPSGPGNGDGYLSWVKQQIEEKYSWKELLEGQGCKLKRVEAGIEYYSIPGGGSSDWGLTVYQSRNRMNCFSTSLPFDSAMGKRSYNKLEVLAGFELLSVNAETVTATAQKYFPSEQWSALKGSTSLCPNLPADFWDRRPVLKHLRQAAWSRGLVPDAVLGTFLAEMSYRMDYKLLLPDVVGKLGVPNIFVALAGTSGAGKSSALQLVKRMLPDEHPTDSEAERVSIGSGEGISKAFYGFKKEELSEGVKEILSPGLFGDDDEKEPRLRRGGRSKVLTIVRHHLYIQIDEGQLLSSLGKRTGSTTMETLRQCWSGDPLGHKNASDDKNFPVPELSYRVAVAMGIQPVLAKELLKDDIGGTPQRFLWVSVDTDPSMPDELPNHPGKLSLRSVCSEEGTFEIIGGTEYRLFEIEPQIVVQLRRDNVLRKQGKVSVGKYDSHRDLSKLKVASIFAYCEGRLTIEVSDWELAEEFMLTSDEVRNWTLRLIDSDQKGREEARTHVEAKRMIAVADIVESEAEKNVVRVAQRLAKRVHEKREKDGAFKSSKVLQNFLGRDYKYRVEAIEYAVEAGWLDRLEGNELMPGASLPALG